MKRNLRGKIHCKPDGGLGKTFGEIIADFAVETDNVSPFNGSEFAPGAGNSQEFVKSLC
jgi:hypothetical protein